MLSLYPFKLNRHVIACKGHHLAAELHMQPGAVGVDNRVDFHKAYGRAGDFFVTASSRRDGYPSFSPPPRLACGVARRLVVEIPGRCAPIASGPIPRSYEIVKVVGN